MSALDLIKTTAREFSEDKVPRLGASLAYYTMFSIAPLLLIAISIAGFVLGKDAAQGQLSAELRGVFGPVASKAIEEMVANAAKPKSGMLATVVGILTLLLGAAGVFGQLKDALNTIWDVEPKKGGGIMGFVKNRFLSLAMVLGVGFLLLVTLILDTAVSVVGTFLGDRLPGGEFLWHALQLAFSFAVATVLFAAIFRFLPDLKIEWRDVWLGAAITAILFAIGKLGLGLYLGKSSVSSTYGAAGSLVVLLVWIYYSAQIVLAGAEFTQVYARSHGSLNVRAAANSKRTETEKTEATPKTVRVPQPVAAGSGHSGLKIAAGGLAGVLAGVVLTFLSAGVLIIKSAKKLLL